MKTIETVALVGPDGVLELRVESGLAEGRHRVRLEIDIDAVSVPCQSRQSVPQVLLMPGIELKGWPRHFSLRREDMYGDDGR
jgi:hypothetical protein